MTITDFKDQTTTMIDSLKAICANFGLGNDGNEFKIISQVFLYKFLHDKFVYQLKQADQSLNHVLQGENWQAVYADMPADDKEMLMMLVGQNGAKLDSHHLIGYLYQKQNDNDFAKLFDDTLIDIAVKNSDVYSVQTATGAKVVLFERLSNFITDDGKRDDFCKAIINKIATFSFEHIFGQAFDFYADIFEYLIKDYNANSGGKYAEYYTPHAVARIMADILIPKEDRGTIKNVSVYDPSAGSGTLLMNIAHAIGEDKCTIYTQDISQKSSHLLRLNLILNGLVLSIPNVIQGNTLLDPYHKENKDDKVELKQFDYIVSNPPFKLDFSDDRGELAGDKHKARFFAGVPNIPKTKKESMAIYQLFIQHIIASLKVGAKSAIVLPTGFITAQSGIDKKIREYLVAHKMLMGVVSMPSNIFATTGTNVSILFIQKPIKNANDDKVILIDASNLGTKIKDGKNQKTVLNVDEEAQISRVFTKKEVVADFSVLVSYEEIIAKNYSLSAGQYFDVKIDYVDISESEFNAKMQGFNEELDKLFKHSSELEKAIKEQLGLLRFGG